MIEEAPQFQVNIADMCAKHQWLLVKQAKYGEKDPWRALVIATQIALFQAATCDQKTHDRIGDDISKIHLLGCLACYKPDAFGQIVHVTETHRRESQLRGIKELGESWIAKRAAEPK